MRAWFVGIGSSKQKKSSIQTTQLAKIIVLFTIILPACTYNKHLKKDQLLLSKNEIKIIDTANAVSNKTDLVAAMEGVIRQKPNSHWVGVGVMPRVKLWKYNTRYSFYENNPDHEKIRERKVEAPVIVNPTSVRLSDSSLLQLMINNGYYYSRVSDTIIKKKHQEAKVVYTVTPGKRYFIKDVRYNIENKRLLALVKKYRSNSSVKKGKVFKYVDLGNERERLYRTLRNAGYYSMKTENIWFEYDTINRSELKDVFENPLGFDINSAPIDENDSVVVYINLSSTRDSTYDEQFLTDRVYVKFNDASLAKKGVKMSEDLYKDLIFQYYELPVRREIIYDNIFLHPNRLYSNKIVEDTYNRLNQMGTFQFVNISFDKSPRDENKLDCIIELTMAVRDDIQLNTDVSNGEEYFLGLGAGINYTTKNLRKGANKLNIQTMYSIESRQIDPDRIREGLFLSATNFKASANLTLPRFLLPFNWKTSRNNTPFTVFSLAHSRINRVGSFKLINTTATFSYNWKETARKTWNVSPLFLSFTGVPRDKLSADFIERIEDSRFLLNTYSNNFIQGENIKFEYTTDLTGGAPQLHTFSFGFEESGSIMQGVNQIIKALANDSISPVAHYVRTEADYRFYLNRRKYQWASRAMVGIGIPTFGDASLPYIKQYSQGGAFSNRGWQLRSLGPGRTQPEDNNEGFRLVDQTGDLKLELNTELRFPLAEVGPLNFKGAAFVDAGNIWLYSEDSTNAGGQFRLDQFWQDMAISSGLGLRLDLSFFVFRLDYAWRLKYPYKLENNGWALNTIKLGNGQWNVAIGYPF